jgi:hypothetical protein
VYNNLPFGAAIPDEPPITVNGTGAYQSIIGAWILAGSGTALYDDGGFISITQEGLYEFIWSFTINGTGMSVGDRFQFRFGNDDNIRPYIAANPTAPSQFVFAEVAAQYAGDSITCQVASFDRTVTVDWDLAVQAIVIP